MILPTKTEVVLGEIPTSDDIEILLILMNILVVMNVVYVIKLG